MQHRAGRAAGDPPEPQLEVLADDPPPPEAGAVGLEEQLVVEEVAVLAVDSAAVDVFGVRFLAVDVVSGHSNRSTIRRSTSSRWATTAATALRA